jgi:hypothetical protein
MYKGYREDATIATRIYQNENEGRQRRTRIQNQAYDDALYGSYDGNDDYYDNIKIYKVPQTRAGILFLSSDYKQLNPDMNSGFVMKNLAFQEPSKRTLLGIEEENKQRTEAAEEKKGHNDYIRFRENSLLPRKNEVSSEGFALATLDKDYQKTVNILFKYSDIRNIFDDRSGNKISFSSKKQIISHSFFHPVMSSPNTSSLLTELFSFSSLSQSSSQSSISFRLVSFLALLLSHTTPAHVLHALLLMGKERQINVFQVLIGRLIELVKRKENEKILNVGIDSHQVELVLSPSLVVQYLSPVLGVGENLLQFRLFFEKLAGVVKTKNLKGGPQKYSNNLQSMLTSFIHESLIFLFKRCAFDHLLLIQYALKTYMGMAHTLILIYHLINSREISIEGDVTNSNTILPPQSFNLLNYSSAQKRISIFNMLVMLFRSVVNDVTSKISSGLTAAVPISMPEVVRPPPSKQMLSQLLLRCCENVCISALQEDIDSGRPSVPPHVPSTFNNAKNAKSLSPSYYSPTEGFFVYYFFFCKIFFVIFFY